MHPLDTTTEAATLNCVKNTLHCIDNAETRHWAQFMVKSIPSFTKESGSDLIRECTACVWLPDKQVKTTADMGIYSVLGDLQSTLKRLSTAPLRTSTVQDF